MSWIDEVQFNEQGLIPAIAQDAKDGQVLMVAWMNKESLQLTVEKNQAVYFSRSRQKLWHKGETSGHFQSVHAIYLDCDADVLVLSVTQHGGIACHTGRRSCFYKQLIDGQWQNVTEVIKNPEDIYGDGATKTTHVHEQHLDKQQLHDTKDVLSALTHILHSRKNAPAESSYVASLYHKGLNKILEKVAEESFEVVIAAKDMPNEDADVKQEGQKRSPQHELVYEVADLWFHTLIMLSHFDLSAEDVLQELAGRFGMSGHDEKASRAK